MCMVQQCIQVCASARCACIFIYHVYGYEETKGIGEPVHLNIWCVGTDRIAGLCFNFCFFFFLVGSQALRVRA